MEAWAYRPKPLPPGEIFWPIFIYRNRLWVIRVLWWVVLPCFSMRENIVAASCTMYSSPIIVKSLQLRRRRQIAEPRKYCLLSVIIFLWYVFFYFFFLTSWIRSNSLHLPPNFRLYNNLFYLQNNLEGRLPSYMASLTSLEYLSFSNNNFLIPSTFSFIFNLSNLKIQLCDNNILALEPTLLLGCKLYWTWIQILYLETRTNYCLLPGK